MELFRLTNKLLSEGSFAGEALGTGGGGCWKSWKQHCSVKLCLTVASEWEAALYELVLYKLLMLLLHFCVLERPP